MLLSRLAAILMDTQSARSPAAVTSSTPGAPGGNATSAVTTANPPAAMSAAVRAPAQAHETSPINRELSLLAFNRRVLALAQDPDVPLLERLRFLCIVSSNLDEFFEIRVAGLREQLRVKAPVVGTTLHELRAHLGEIGLGAQALVAAMYRTLNEQILPALIASGVRM